MQWFCYLLLAAGMTAGQDAVLLEFTRPDCQVCQSMQPTIAALESQGMAVRHVDVARERHLAQRFRISSYPTYVVISGGREITRLHGAQSLETLRQSLSASTRPNLQNTGARTLAEPASPEVASAAHANPTLDDPAHANPVAHASAEPMPNMQTARAIERAQAATVRLRVRESGSTGVATGTVIDTHGNEALVLTCGHVFRDSQGKAPIEVDVYAHGRVTTVPGQLIDYDADTRDIALVSIEPGFPIEAVPVVSIEQLPSSGSVAFSFGCDRGADPTRRDTRVTAVNKYNQHLKASNLEIAGAPTIGRSGGGLFDSSGRIIGVCNAADFEDNIGIYAGPGAIHWQLDRINMAHLYAARPATSGLTTVLPATDGPAADRQVADLRATDLQANAGQSNPEVRLAAASSAPVRAGAVDLPADGANHEVIVILRDKSRPHTPAQVKTFDQAPAELLKLLGRN